MKIARWLRREIKMASPFGCPFCGGVGADDMGWHGDYRCDRCHCWYTP